MRTTDNFDNQPPRNSNNTNRPNRAAQRPSQNSYNQNSYYDDEPVKPRPKRPSIKMVPWYDCLIANYLYLFLLAPVGIWRMYVNKRFTPMIKIIISCVSLTWFLILLIYLFVSGGGLTPTIAPTAIPTATYTPFVATETPAVTETPEPTATPDPDNTTDPTINGTDIDVTIDDDDDDAITTTVASTSTLVWATTGGENYHIVDDCRGMKGAVQMTVEEARASGKSRCYKCYNLATNTPKPTAKPSTPKPSATPKPISVSSSTKIWYNANGKYFHQYSTCSGMSGAVQSTVAIAKENGKIKCPVCIK